MSIKINIGEILTKAWQITWKFKILWIFGILASCTGNDRGSLNFNSSGGGGNSGSGPSNGELPDFLREFEKMRPEQALQSFFDQYMGIIVAIILALCVLWFIFYFFGIMGRTGLIKGIGKADAGATSLSFGEIWSESLAYFGRMFGLSLLIGLPFFLITILLLVMLGVGMFGAIQGDLPDSGMVAAILGMAGVFFAGLCCLSLIAMIVGLIVELAQNAVVLENLGVIAGLQRGWEVFRKNIISVFLMGIILWVVGIVVSLIIALPLIAVLVPVILGVGAAAATENWIILAIVLGGCILLWLPIGLLLGGIQQTYFQAVWTLTYRRLTAPVEPQPAIAAPLENLELQ